MKLEPHLKMNYLRPKQSGFAPKTMLRYAAVLIPFMILAGVSWYFMNDLNSPPLSSLDKVLYPGSQKATLVLSDGQVHELDEDNLLAEMKQGECKGS